MIDISLETQTIERLQNEKRDEIEPKIELLEKIIKNFLAEDNNLAVIKGFNLRQCL